MLRSLLVVPFLIALLVGCGGREVVRPESVGLSSERLAAVGETIQAVIDDGQLAGAVGLVARDGEIAWLEAFGSRNLEAGVPMTTDTLFRICSMSKPITSVGILLLVDEGRIDLDDPVTRFIPEFRGVKVLVPDEGDGGGFRLVDAERPITVEHLLTHTAGLTYGFIDAPQLGRLYEEAGVSDGLVETPGTIADNARRIAKLPLKFQPGTAWHYSLATDVLGRVIEVASGKRLDVFLRERIFEPLGMDDTGFRVSPEKLERLASVYQPGDDGTVEPLPKGVVRTGKAVYSESYPYLGEGTYFSGGAGLVSTARDYSRFLRMLANEGELDGVRLLEAETVRAMTTDRCSQLGGLFQSHGDGFGLGVGVVTEAFADKGLGSVGTFSWGGFYYTYFWVDPEEELVGIVLGQLYPWGELKLWDEFRTAVYAALED